MRKHRVLAGRVVRITMALAGLAVGYFAGGALAVRVAENWLDQYAKLANGQNDAAFVEAREALGSLKGSPASFCSDTEIASFRELVFRSEYLKDAGRMRGGRIECSATSGHFSRAIAKLNPQTTEEDGLIAYNNLAPVRESSLKRPGLQLGTAFVVIGPHLPTGIGPIPMHLDVRMKDAVRDADEPSANGAKPGPAMDMVRRQGDTLYATRCSTLHLGCVTASASVADAVHGELGILIGGTLLGCGIGILIGMAFSFAYNRSSDHCQQLRRAVTAGKLQLVYQPIVHLKTRRIVGAEALARWNDEDGNAVPPDVFIKLAEEHGFVGEITKFVVKRALRDFADTLRTRSDFRLSINVAGDDLQDPEFMPMLEHALHSAKVEPSSLVIEITERSTAENPVAMEAIRLLRRNGHSIHIDDFGTGYSNLDKLLYLFADTIKIDKAFTKVIGTEAVTAAILPQIMAMAKSLNLEVVVEGVETDHQADYFTHVEQKVYGQGWLYGRPVTAEAFHGLLAGEWARALTATEMADVRPGNSRMTGPQLVASLSRSFKTGTARFG